MKLNKLLAVCSMTIMVVSVAALADQQMGMSEGIHHDAMGGPTGMPMHGLSEGTVRKVAKDTGKVTIAHGPLENLDMPSMTMVFRVKDAAWLDQMKPGDKIRFMADRVYGLLTVIKYEPVK